MACLTTFLFLPTGDYVIVHGEHGQLKLSDVYYLPLTYLQQEEIAWVRTHIPPTDKIITVDGGGTRRRSAL